MRLLAMTFASIVGVATVFLSGCGSSPPPKSTTAPPAPVNAPPPPPAPTQPPVVSAPALGSPPANTTVATPPVALPPLPNGPAGGPPAVTPPAATPPAGDRVKFGDVGKKDFGGPAILKPITVPMQVYSMAKWKTVEFTVQSGLNNYKAINGFAPKTEKDFFDDVIKANQIDLPKLKDGERYVFDVENQQLMVEQPAQ